MTPKNLSKKLDSGFTLLELLIVVGIIATLSIVLIITFKPVETLQKSRDSQRIADLNALKTAIAVYMVSTSTPVLSRSVANNDECKTGAGGGTYSNLAVMRIRYSWPRLPVGATQTISDRALDKVNFTYAVGANQVLTTALSNTNATGWLQVNFDSLRDGSPISHLPVDPTNRIANRAAVLHSDLVYRYACNRTSMTFELDARLESLEYTTINNKHSSDGGNNANLYEVGTNLKILGDGIGAGGTIQF